MSDHPNLPMNTRCCLMPALSPRAPAVLAQQAGPHPPCPQDAPQRLSAAGGTAMPAAAAATNQQMPLRDGI